MRPSGCVREYLSYMSECTANFQPYTYWHLVILSCPISQHLASIFVFLAIFMRLRQRLLDPRALVWMSAGVFLTGYTIWELLERGRVDKAARATNRTSRAAASFCACSLTRQFSLGAKALKASILVFLALMSLSPVLKTLTAATSSDSIWALSACLFILNALLADYTAMRPRGLQRERYVISQDTHATLALTPSGFLP